MSMLLQSLVVTLLVVWSLLVMLRRLFPQAMTVAQNRLVALMAASGQPRLAAALKREAPAAAGCGSGCGSCAEGCPSRATAQPVQWRSPSSPGNRH